MTNFKLKSEYLPDNIYPGIDFALLKSEFKVLSDDYIDYGSLFLIKKEEFAISINHIGKVICYYNDHSTEQAKETLHAIESVFQNHDYQIEYT